MLGSHFVSLTDILSFQIYSSSVSSTVWGRPDFRLPPTYAAFVNGVAVRQFPCLFNGSIIITVSGPENISEIARFPYFIAETIEVKRGEVACLLSYVAISVFMFLQ